MEIKVTLSQNLKQKPQDETKLGFGKIFTDHMFLMDYYEGEGWKDPRVVPFADFSMSPAATVLHYGQAIFEGMKCYRRADGGLQPYSYVAQSVETGGFFTNGLYMHHIKRPFTFLLNPIIQVSLTKINPF